MTEGFPGSPIRHFNGAGYPKRKVYTGPKVPFPAGGLEDAVRTGNRRGAPIALPRQSVTPSRPSMPPCSTEWARPVGPGPIRIPAVRAERPTDASTRSARSVALTVLGVPKMMLGAPPGKRFAANDQ